MKSRFKLNILAASILAATSFASIAGDINAEKANAENFDTSIDLSFRYRIETVDQTGFANDAEASTLRTRATIKTKWIDNISTLIEFDDVSEIGWDDYNGGAGTTPNRTQFPVIADPQGTEVNQAYVQYASDDTKAAFGRQRILVGTQRFVGGVGWRQNEQTYDSFTFKTKFARDLEFNYAYVFNVNRIFGESVDGGDHEHNTHLINADYKIADGKLSGYFFAIDNNDAFVLSNNTFGVRYDGKFKDVSYVLEYATQSDAGDNPNNYSADYYLLDGNYKIDNASIGAGLEVLGGDAAGGQGFTTSLATLHKFQGWADVFLGTPTTGIEDLYIKASYKINGYTIKAFYHDFSNEQGGGDLGTEIDFLASKKINKDLSGLLKFASFNSDSAGFASRDKIWLMLTYKL
ncbi:MAG: alginate export family protein [Kangiellaceae bacterium]|nr:alginate export family protein [Kangiellaceae bacterium]